MQELINFFINIGRLKGKKRKGWTKLHKIENSESTAEHSFRIAMLAWFLAKKRGLNADKCLKMALLHDLCEVFSEDETPYDLLLPKDDDRRKIEELRKIRSRIQYTPEQREERLTRKFQNELRGLEELIVDLSPDFKNEVRSLWLEFTKGLTEEGRFVKQIDKMENLLQALEYWEVQGQIERDLWLQAAREWCVDPVLISFLKEIEVRFPSQEEKSGSKTQ